MENDVGFFGSKLGRQAGYSLLEVAMAVVISGMMAIYGVQFVVKKLEADRIDAEVSWLVSAINRLVAGNFASSNSFMGLTTEYFAKSGVVPSSSIVMNNVETTIANAYGGKVVAKAKERFGIANNVAVFYYNNLPKAQCPAFVKALAAQFGQSDRSLLGIVVQSYAADAGLQEADVTFDENGYIASGKAVYDPRISMSLDPALLGQRCNISASHTYALVSILKTK